MNSDPGLRRPFGLFLCGGGALGCWQAAFLRGLDAAALAADAVMGVSVGALNGAGHALGLGAECWGRWARTDGGIMRLAPRLWPFALFSSRPIREHIGASGERELRARLRCPLTVVSLTKVDRRRVYGRFMPAGSGGWDGPIRDHLVASCAIPGVFPPVSLDYRGRRLRLVDGGLPSPEALDLAPLAGCRDIAIVDPCRTPDTWLELGPRVRALQSAAEPPRVFWIAPRRPLDFGLFDFRAASLRRGLAQGEEDARRFLRDPRAFLLPERSAWGWGAPPHEAMAQRRGPIPLSG